MGLSGSLKLHHSGRNELASTAIPALKRVQGCIVRRPSAMNQNKTFHPLLPRLFQQCISLPLFTPFDFL